ncbi:CBS domain-containing protein cbsx1 chloroplastic [Phtheirospermum japonicum]|uniref:CBS domain-containing protein cbsx1 chloroplastic n=1 Tax=Phtheirospermum japonicum TaxID=374723 RepID=A0A830BTB5_9LAMI|nr:CBS domain-containing protein cbsx1 chloroplastic [Phtheirospermum japonicum]
MTSISRLELPHLSILHPSSAAARLQHQIPCGLLCQPGPKLHHIASLFCVPNRTSGLCRPVLVAAAPEQPKNGAYVVGDFMTRKEELHVVKSTTTVDEALEMLVENRITGFPVIDDDWKLVGLVSDYDLLALDSVSGTGRTDTDMFPEVDSTWKTFNEVQKLLSKTNGQLVGDLMTPAPVVVHETTNLEHAARLLLETKYRRLPVVDDDGKLVGIITRGNVVRAALQIKRIIETV